MTAEREQLLTRDNFVNVLQLKNITLQVRHRDQLDALYKVILDFLAALDASVEPRASVAVGDLALRIPGTGVHVRLTGFVRESLADLAVAFLLIPPGGRSIAIATNLIRRAREVLSYAKKALGERCLLEAMGEVDIATKENLCLQLLDLPCRYLEAGCQFMTPKGICGFHLKGVDDSLHDLESRKMVQRAGVAEPYTWKVIL